MKEKRHYDVVWCDWHSCFSFCFISLERVLDGRKEGRKMRRDEARLHGINEIDVIQVSFFHLPLFKFAGTTISLWVVFRSYVLVAGRGLQWAGI